MSTSTPLSILCGILWAAPTGGFFTLKVVEDSLVSSMPTGRVIRPIDDQFQAMHSSILGESCHGCRNNKAQLPPCQHMLNISLGPKHLRNWFGSDAFYLSSVRTSINRLLYTSTIEPLTYLHETQSTTQQPSTLMCNTILSRNALETSPST